MKEVFEEYGGVVIIALMGAAVIGGLLEVMLYMHQIGLF